MHRFILPVVAVLLLSGCTVVSTLDKLAKVAMNPGIQVGSDQDQPSQVSFSLVAEPDVNASGVTGSGISHDDNSNDDAISDGNDNDDTDDSDQREDGGTPVNFQIVMLAEDSKFLSSDYDQVTDDLKKALGKNYLDHQDYTLLPGQFKYLPPVKLDGGVRYIGVIVHYADADSAQWRKVVKVKSKGRSYHILVHLYADSVDLQAEEE